MGGARVERRLPRGPWARAPACRGTPSPPRRRAAARTAPAPALHTLPAARALPRETWGLIGLWMGTTWLACCVQACWGQARQVPQPLDWFAYAGIQVELRCCLVTCMSNAKVIFCVCTLSHALTLAPPEPGSQETADLLVPPEPGREASFACAQPG